MLEEIKKQYSESDKISLLIRHADRDKIPAGEFGNDVLLNETGKERALQFGKSLSELKINKIVTTNIKRCIQTAECIARGYGHTIEMEPSSTFGGLHLTNGQLANEFLNKYGYEEWYRNIITGKQTQGICDTETYEELMTNFLTNNTTERGLTIFVSHDFLIAFYHYALNGTKYTMFSDWVNFLSGLMLKNGQYVAGFQNN
jgi:broad specificity phosphatase PhoE